MSDTKSIILGTAGHVDHGKTTLVKSLTGVDTDRLKEEKERGITIELGFASLDLPSGNSIGVVDVPGHEKFVKNMVAGAVGMDMVALVIAADEGVMPQTTEHLEICQLLGVNSGLVVLTKKDMVDEEWLELVRDDVRQFLQGTFLEDSPLLTVSAVTGDGLDELLQILDTLASDTPGRAVSGPYRLPVDRVFTSKGFGTVVTGTTISGQISVGDSVVVYTSGMETRIRGIQNHGVDAERAEPGLRTALNLQGVGRDQIKRGDVVSVAGALHPSFLLDLEFTFLESAEKPMKHRTPVRFHAGTAEVMGRILLRKDAINPGETEPVQIQLESPVAVLPGDFYVIRSYSPVRTVGGGRILHPVPRKRKRSRPELWDEMNILARGSEKDLITCHVRGSGLRGLDRDEIAVRTGLYGKPLAKEIERLLGGKVLVRADSEGRLVHADVYDDLKKKIVAILAEYHAANPLVAGLAKEELRSRLFSPSGQTGRDVAGASAQRLFHKALEELEKQGYVAVEQDVVRLAGHEVALGEKENAIRKALDNAFAKAGLQPPSQLDLIEAISEDVDVSKKSVEDVFALMVREGALVRLRDNIFLHPESLGDIEGKVVKFLKKNGEMGVNDFRKLAGGISRKYMIPILEHLDSRKITLRIGDVRKLRGGLGKF